MPGVFNLGDVLQLVIDRFYQGAFPQQDFVRYAHQGVLHVILHFGYQLYAVEKEALEQSLPDISLVRAKFTLYVLQELFLLQRLTVIYIPRREHEIENFSLVIDYQMQFESEKPSHGTFSTLRKPFKSLMNQYALVTAHTQRSGIYKADAGTGAHQYLLDENSQLQQNFLLQFHKTVIGHTFREEVCQMLADIFLVVMLETPETSRMEQDQDDHDFRITHPVRLVSMFMTAVFNHIFFLYFGKFLAKIIRHTINLRNFSL